MLYILFVITIALVILNFFINDRDLFHPAVIFCAIFSVYELMCIVFQQEYQIQLHLKTVVVLISGMAVFSIISFFAKTNEKKILNMSGSKPPHFIEIDNGWVCFLLFVQLLAILFFYKYLNSLSMAHDGQARSLGEKITLYDNMTKFWGDYYRSLNVPVPMVYRICNPLSAAGSHLVFYVLINNFVSDRKINILHIASVFLLCIQIILNGSRSPLFRLLTMGILLFYILEFKQKNKRIDLRFIMKLAALVLVAGILFVVMLKIIRNKDNVSLGKYLFIYLGAPIVNLDSFIEHGIRRSPDAMFGEQTFRSLYAYLGKLFGKDDLIFTEISGFAFSDNGIEIGNVYTMFLKIVYDFGTKGVIPIMIIMASYYILTYDRIQIHFKQDTNINFSLFIYSYLFNDLIMSAFSCRFFETALDAPFLKLLLVSWFMNFYIIEKRLNFGRKKLVFPRWKIDWRWK